MDDKFMEYFTGDMLSDIPTQEHMTDFRTKLAIILVDSELNDDNIRNRDMKEDDNNTDATECMILDRPPENFKTSNTSTEVELISRLFILLPSVNPTNDDLIDELCLFIGMVDDIALLESEGVKSSDPYPISLNLRQIKNILSNDEYMDIHCFNMAVRILACHEVQLLRDIPSHYMDLNFCSMFHYARDSSHHEHMEIATLKRLFYSWPDGNDYHISQCDMILFPWYMFGLFLLFVLDQNRKVVSIFDPIPIPTFGKNVLKTVADNLNLALEVANPTFKDDISKWECIVPDTPTNSH
uniref:Uncharacterized protein n=1 Tax=Triticum urartu TaxID=4572 RepID=A0A8R7UEJ0_TRIUA